MLLINRIMQTPNHDFYCSSRSTTQQPEKMILTEDFSFLGFSANYSNGFGPGLQAVNVPKAQSAR